MVKVYILGPRNSLKCGPLLCLGPQCYTKALDGVIIRQGLLLAVYAEVVKGHELAYGHC